jgi:hypothetical protein
MHTLIIISICLVLVGLFFVLRWAALQMGGYYQQSIGLCSSLVERIMLFIGFALAIVLFAVVSCVVLLGVVKFGEYLLTLNS